MKKKKFYQLCRLYWKAKNHNCSIELLEKIRAEREEDYIIAFEN